jgi:hypothetical protein
LVKWDLLIIHETKINQKYFKTLKPAWYPPRDPPSITV